MQSRSGRAINLQSDAAGTLALNGNGGDNIDDNDDYLQALVV